MRTKTWVDAGDASALEEEDVIAFEHGGQDYAIIRDKDGQLFAVDGLCTHEHVHLCDGLVLDGVIECPAHNGRFDFRTGAIRGGPVVEGLGTHRVKEDRGRILIEV